MKIVAGLGNPGPDYAATRHNAGWMAAEKLARLVRAVPRSCPDGGLATADDLAVFKPLAYMNRTGPALARLLKRRQTALQDLLVLVDDVNLPLGSIRLRREGSSGGHKGLRSVIGALGTEQFPRLRMGIGPAPDGTALREFVLSPFAPSELEAADQMTTGAAQAALCWAREGLGAAMNRFNCRADQGSA